MTELSKERIDLIKATWSERRESAMRRFRESAEPVWQFLCPVSGPIAVSPYSPEVTLGATVEILTFTREFRFDYQTREKTYRIMCDGYEVERGDR
jgi:hypothetical protein